MARSTPSPPRWASRIVGQATVPAGSLLANEANWRIHPMRQQAALGGSLSEVGWVQQVVVNKRSSPEWGTSQDVETLVDGHLRVSLALSQGEETPVPVLFVDLTPAEERLVLATLDPLSAMAVADKEQLDALLREVSTSDDALQQMLADLAEQSGLDYGGKNGQVVEDDIPEPPVEPITKPGDLWLLGTYVMCPRCGGHTDSEQPPQAEANCQHCGHHFQAPVQSKHRLLCGDSTRREDVERLMGGERAEMVWTDPPYGVAIGDKNKYLNSIAPSNRVEENLENDTLDETALLAMLRASFGLAVEHCLAGAAWYVAAPAGPLHVLFGSALKELGIWRQTIQWVKNNATFAPPGVDYHWRAEPIFYGWLPNAAHRYRGDRKQTTVWEIDRPQASPEHPTMKPVALIARAVENSSESGQIVYDGFLGSGTTIIAAEQLGRRAFACEIEPRYVQVALERYAKLTGNDPIREDGITLSELKHANK